MKKIIPILLIFILLLTTVHAQQEDFNAYGPIIIKTAQCKTYQFPIQVTNTGSIESTYYLEVDGTAANWIKFSAASFKLQPEETTIVNGFLDAPCDSIGDYTLNIYIITSYGLEKVIMQDITVNRPLNADIKAKTWMQEISPCQTAEYKLTIINPETFPETYTFETGQFQKDTTFSQDSITLQANTSKDITIEITPKDCSLTGAYNIPFRSIAEKTGTTAEIGLQLEIQDTGMPLIAEGIDIIKSDVQKESSVEIEIFNKHTGTKTYLVEIDGPTWISTDADIITLEAEKTEKIPLYLRPTEAIEPGEYPVTIKITDEKEAEFSKELTVKLRKSTFLGKLFSDYIVYTISGIVLLIVLAIVIFFIANKLTDEKAIKARAKRRKERARKKEAIKKLKEKEKKQIEKEQKRKEKEKQKKDKAIEKERQKAVKKYEKQIKAEYELISKEAIAEGQKVHDRWLLNMILFFVILAILYIGIKLRTLLWNNVLYVGLGIAILLVLLILRKITRLKKSVARWRGLTLARETILMHIGWKKGLHQISFKLDAPAKNVKVIAKKGRTRHAKYVHPKDHVYRYFSIISSVQNIDIKESKIRFRVSKQWMKIRDIKPEDVSLAMLKHGQYNKTKATREGSDKNYVYYNANTDGFGQFAIVGKTSAKERYKSRGPAIIALIILLILAGGITAMIASNGEQIQVKGIPPQSWNQDLQHSLDLNKYFNDPDGDELTYTFNELDNIDVWVNGGVAYFMPEYKWSGQRTIIFTATDGKGGEVKSNPVKLVVKKTILPQEYRGYLKYILTGIIILILIITFLIFRKPVLKWLNEE